MEKLKNFFSDNKKVVIGGLTLSIAAGAIYLLTRPDGSEVT